MNKISPEFVAEKAQERLVEYGVFDAQAIEAAQRVAVFQASHETYQSYLGYFGISEKCVGAPFVDIRPRERDAESAVVVHLPMANPLDENQLFQMASIANTMPNRRIIGFANPSGGDYDAATPGFKQLRKIAAGDFTSNVENLARYLEKNGITTIDQIGPSYGADLALALGQLDAVEVRSQLLIEPASVVMRSIMKLAADFKKSDAALNDYVQANNLPQFEAARKESISPAAYALGLLKPINVAVASGIAKGRFIEFVTENDGGIREAIGKSTTFVWGGESELCDGEKLQVVTSSARATELGAIGIEIPGGKHALMNDLHLMAALIDQSFTAPKN